MGGLGGLVLAIPIGVGGVEVVRAVLGRLPADFNAAVIARGQRRWTSVLTRVGMLAHGLSLLVLAAHCRRRSR